MIGFDLHLSTEIGLDLRVNTNPELGPGLHLSTDTRVGHGLHVNTDTGAGLKFRVTVGLGPGLPNILQCRQDCYRQLTTAQRTLILIFVTLAKLVLWAFKTIDIILREKFMPQNWDQKL